MRMVFTLSSTILAALLGVTAARAAPLEFPTDWKAGTAMRFRVEWRREVVPATATPSSGTDDVLNGEVAIRVEAAPDESLHLSWTPEVADDWRPHIAPNANSAQGLPSPDTTAAAGSLLWRHLHVLTQELILTPDPQGVTVTMANADAVQDLQRDEIHKVAKLLGLDVQCTATSTDVLCARVATAEVAAQWVVRESAPLFRCVGLKLDGAAPTRWNTTAEIEGIDSTREHVAEVLHFDSSAAELYVRLIETLDGESLAQAIDHYAEQITPEAFARMRALVLETHYSFETDCRMDRASGWPIEVIHVNRVRSPWGETSERSHYVRVHQGKKFEHRRTQAGRREPDILISSASDLWSLCRRSLTTCA